MRKSEINRETKETQVYCQVNLDSDAQSKIDTKIGFFDHMLELFAFHAGIELNIKANGDIQVDDHHIIEDIGITLGTALKEAIGDKKGIARYACEFVPMDEALARVCLDISNRSYLVFQAELKRNEINGFALEMVEEFLRAFAYNFNVTLHVQVEYGNNDHHKVEAIFKALGRALAKAIKQNGDKLPSTKGTL